MMIHIFILLIILMIINVNIALKPSFKKHKYDRLIRNINMVETSKQSSSSSSSEEDDKVMKTIEILLKAAKEGNMAELKKQGFDISSKNEADSLLERISDPVLRDQILGQMGIDELELLEDMKRVRNDENFEGYEGGDIDMSLFDEIRQEASTTLEKIRNSESSSMGALLGDEFTDIVKSVDPSKIISSENISGSKNILSPIPVSFIMDAPPERSPANQFEVEELEDNDDNDNNNNDNNNNDNNILNEALLKKAFESELPITEKSSGTSSGTNQDMFTQLLKATMQSAEEEAAKAPEEVIATTVDLVSKGSTGDLDIRSILGEAMASMADQLGVDIKGDVLESPSTKGELNAIMAKSMSELAKNFEELDGESKELYAKLERLQTELVSSTQEFEESRQEELDALLAQQAQYKTEMIKSAKKVKESTENLERLMKDLDQNADVMTSLALFPVKRIDQKITFVLGLALVFKVPFDIFQLWSVRSTDPSDWLTILTQTGLCLAFMNNYGLIGALFKSKK